MELCIKFFSSKAFSASILTPIGKQIKEKILFWLHLRLSFLTKNKTIILIKNLNNGF